MANRYSFPLYRILSLTLVISFLLSSHSAWAVDNTQIALKHLHIKQEQYKTNGVLVSRPNPLDKKIVDIIDLNGIRSLEDYARWLNKTIHYKADHSGDRWATPQETLHKHSGDCEDYTFLNASVLRVLGYQPRFMALQKRGSAHAICVFKADGYYLWFDNTHLVKTKARTLQEFAQFITRQYHYPLLLELDLNTNQWNILYRRS